MKTEGATSNDNTVKQLYDQFKFHLIYQNKIKQSKNIVTDSLKDLLSEVKRQCKTKRHRKKMLEENIENLSKAETCRPSSTVQGRIWRPPSINLNNLQLVKQQILVVQNQGDNISSQIFKLQESLGTLKGKIHDLKAHLKLEQQRQQKFKHIEYLSRNIQRTTQNSKLNNTRSYKKLVKYQMEIISNLRKFKGGLKKENQTIENKFVEFEEKKMAKMIQSKINFLAVPSITPQYSTIKIDKAFISKLEELLNLFMEKEDNFEDIKAEISTKVRFKKVNKSYLKDERIKFHEMIERFEEYYDVKIESLPNLIIYLYNKLKESNQETQNECIKRTQIRESLIKDVDELKSKKYYVQQDLLQNLQSSQPEVTSKTQIYNNSVVLVHTINLLHNLLAKFKYLFTISLTLSLEKKNFQPLLVQINHIYSHSHIFNQENNDSQQVDYNITNFRQIQALLDSLKDKFMLNKDEILGLMSNDLRYSLIFRFDWIQEQLSCCRSQSEILQKISQIQQKCEQIYKDKLKNYFKILQKCFKSLTMNKYQKKMIMSSNAKQQLFLSIFKPIKATSAQHPEDYQINSQKENYNSIDKFNTEENQQSLIPQTPFFKENPSSIIKILQNIKNKNKQIFKPISVQITKNYIANTNVVIPKIK